MKVSSVKVCGLVALGTVVGFVDGCGSGAAELSGDFPTLTSAQLVSMAYDSYDPCDEFSKEPVLNMDGRFVTYASKGTDVIADDQTQSGSYNDVFRFDRLTQQNVIVSVRQDGVQANVDDMGCAHRSDISDDGKIIVFQTKASNLLSGFGPYGESLEDLDDNGYCDIFVKNMVTGALECITLPAALDDDTSVGASDPKISGNGQFVCFESCYDFLPGGNSEKEVWVYDRVAGTYEIASTDNEGRAIGYEYGYGCFKADISGNGRYVVFSTEAEVDERDTNDCLDIYRFDRQNRRLELVSVSYDGTDVGRNDEGDYGSQQAMLSADGRYVAFKSQAANLISSDVNNFADVFLRDMVTGTTVCCSRGMGGVEAEVYDESWESEGVSQRPSISADGRYVVFDSVATNLVEDDTNEVRDVFVFDRVTGQTRRVANHPCQESVVVDQTLTGIKDVEGATYICQHTPSISGDGRFVAFMRGGNNTWHYPIIIVAPNPFFAGESDATTPLPPMVEGGF